MRVLGYLQIVGTLEFGLIRSTRVNYYTRQDGWAAQTVYEEFYKNNTCLYHYGCSYTYYIVHIIDKLLAQIDLADQSFASKSPKVEVEYCGHHIVSLDSDLVCNATSSSNVKTFVQGANNHLRHDTV